MRRFAAVSFLLFIFLAVAHASDMRCGNKLVVIGDRFEDILDKCGVPDVREARPEKRYYRVFGEWGFIEGLQEVNVEEWTYNLGPTRFIRILRFENGRLAEVETGDYGY